VSDGLRFRSYTQLSTYEDCPEMYRLKYIERIREEPAVWSVGGTAFHQVAEWYLNGELGPDPNDARLQSAWSVAWDSAVSDVIAHNPDANPDINTWRFSKRRKEDAAWWKGAGLAMVHDFVGWRQSTGSSLVVFSDDEREYIEHELLVTLGGVPVKLIPDLLVVDEHGQLDIVDWKTGRPPKEATQLGVYRAGVLAGLGLDATWGLYYMARDAQLIPVDLRKYEPDDIGLRFAKLETQIQLEAFDPTPGSACGFCPYKAKLCRYYNPEVTT
jgi:RecB family exonuclease